MKFLGENPADWLDDLGFTYELRFESEPTDEQCAALAHAWTAHCEGKTPTRAGAVEFSREFAYLLALPRRPGKGERDLFKHVATFLKKKVHGAIAPLTEVVLLTAAADFPDLDPGPKVPASQRPESPDHPEPGPREAYQAVVRELMRKAKEERFAKWTAEPPAGMLGLRVVERPGPGVPQVAETLRAGFPPEGEGSYPMCFSGSSSRPTWVPAQYAQTRKEVDLRIGGEVRTIALPDGLTTRGIAAPHPDGSRIAVAAFQGKRGILVMVDTATGALSTPWSTEADEISMESMGVGWLTDDHLVVTTAQRMVALHVPTEGEASVTHQRKGDRHVVSCREGRLLYEVNGGFFAWNGAKISPATKWKVDYLYFHSESEDSIVLRQGKPREEGPDDTYFEVTHLDEVLAAKATPKKKAVKKTATQKAPKKKAAKTAWEPVDVEPPMPEPDDEAHPARDGWTHPGNPADNLLRWGPEKNPTIVRASDADALATLSNEGVTLVHGDRIHKVETYMPKRLAISPGGTRAYALQSNLSVIIAISEESADGDRVVWSDEAKLGEIGDFAPVGEDELVVFGKRATVWLKRVSAGKWDTLARSTAIKGGQRAVAEGERIAVLAAGAKNLLVVERDGDALKKVSAEKSDATELFVRDGALHAVTADGVLRYAG